MKIIIRGFGFVRYRRNWGWEEYGDDFWVILVFIYVDFFWLIFRNLIRIEKIRRKIVFFEVVI